MRIPKAKFFSTLFTRAKRFKSRQVQKYQCQLIPGTRVTPTGNVNGLEVGGHSVINPQPAVSRDAFDTSFCISIIGVTFDPTMTETKVTWRSIRSMMRTTRTTRTTRMTITLLLLLSNICATCVNSLFVSDSDVDPCNNFATAVDQCEDLEPLGTWANVESVQECVDANFELIGQEPNSAYDNSDYGGSKPCGCTYHKFGTVSQQMLCNICIRHNYSTTSCVTMFDHPLF